MDNVSAVKLDDEVGKFAEEDILFKLKKTYPLFFTFYAHKVITESDIVHAREVNAAYRQKVEYEHLAVPDETIPEQVLQREIKLSTIILANNIGWQYKQTANRDGVIDIADEYHEEVVTDLTCRMLTPAAGELYHFELWTVRRLVKNNDAHVLDVTNQIKAIGFTAWGDNDSARLIQILTEALSAARR